MISKTAYLKFEQCSKAFYLYKKHPYLKDKVELDKQLTFNRGHQIGFLAQQLFPDGIDVSKDSKNTLETLEKTNQLIAEKFPVIYEATFTYNSLLVMVDVLVLIDGNYYAYEVKNAVKVNEVFLKDACLQYYVLKNKIQLADFFLVTVNNTYVFNGKIDVKQLFKKRSIKQEAENNLNYFDVKVAQALLTLDNNAIPNVEVGENCFKPYVCDFYQTCWKGKVDSDSIFNLPYISKKQAIEFYKDGIQKIEDLPNEINLPKKALIIKESLTNKSVYLDELKLNEFLNTIDFNFCALDIEVLSTSIPDIINTKPFEQIPFLFCVYDNVTENYFYTNHKSDERNELLNALIAYTKNYKSVLVFDATMEISVINKLIELFPNMEFELTELKQKIVDVYDVFLNLTYYDYKFGNNFNLKAISSILLNKNFYNSINSGLQAMSLYENCRKMENIIEAELIKQDLINYCFADTKATIEIVNYLKTLKF
ncbi:MAG: DUF2779 domain-containing protein [Bacteroidetes bacterium]|nr:DUF2779 domain-containing protein [Bacteroidota bacterium]